ncbi:MAG: cytochrome c [Gammaproteobacteria bacterium]|nr:cytochrome c [Gammaproteobacteria bacterium]
MNTRGLVAGLLWLVVGTGAWGTETGATHDGEAIYRRGTLVSGAALEGTRPRGGVGLKGAAAACINCHRRSGLGATEGAVTIPPVTGEYLFHARGATTEEPALPYVENMRANRDPYTDATLARAIREGLDSQGRPLNDLMPRFALSDEDMAALVKYLRSLGARAAAGVTPTELHFATVVTPEADPVQRRAMLDVLAQYVTDKNAFPFGPSPQMRASGRTMFAKSMYVANRHWQVYVWELTGPVSSWRTQLDQAFARQPVMAVLSGLGGRHWAPVHDFCEQQQVPCLFPNVEVPEVADGDFYSLYFSRGVLLEAELIARRLQDTLRDRHGTVRQIYRADDSGEPAAQALAAALRSSDIEVQDQALSAGKPGQGVPAALRGATKADVLVLWLRPADLAVLGVAPTAPAEVYMSGLMGGLERAPLPVSWRGRVRMTYPFDLPGRRVVRVDYALGWLSLRHIPVVAEQLQADTYLACGVLADTLNHMADVSAPDYLVERIQEMLDHRILTGYYPRLTLANGQTVASKGGYLMRFAGSSGAGIVPDGDWTVP